MNDERRFFGMSGRDLAAAVFVLLAAGALRSLLRGGRAWRMHRLHRLNRLHRLRRGPGLLGLLGLAAAALIGTRLWNRSGRNAPAGW